MDENGFRNWLLQYKGQSKKTASSRISNCRRIEAYEGNLDQFYRIDKMASLIERLKYTQDYSAISKKLDHNIPINGNKQTGSATLKQAANLYLQFKEYEKGFDIHPFQSNECNTKKSFSKQKNIKSKYTIIDETIYRIMKILARYARFHNPEFIERIVEEYDNSNEQWENNNKSIKKDQPDIVIEFSSTRTNGQIEGIDDSMQQEDNPKIGEYVQKKIKYLITKNVIDEQVVEDLLSPIYCKAQLKTGFPLLRTISQGIYDHKGRARYYMIPLLINDEKYFFSSQWYEKQRESFDNWCQSILQKKNFETGSENIMQNSEEGVNMNQNQVKRAIQSVGMGCFVKYFEEFLDDNNSVEDLVKLLKEREHYSEAASRSRRVKNARSIIKNGHAHEVLLDITKSDRLDYETIKKAKELIKKYFA
ncbi:MAG: hypothetical protein JEZ00_13300 [Anaerolineaceae bacterium]|nr:hypothetical protein [Anaerolineaceae bacterium]